MAEGAFALSRHRPRHLQGGRDAVARGGQLEAQDGARLCEAADHDPGALRRALLGPGRQGGAARLHGGAASGRDLASPRSTAISPSYRASPSMCASCRDGRKSTRSTMLPKKPRKASGGAMPPAGREHRRDLRADARHVRGPVPLHAGNGARKDEMVFLLRDDARGRQGDVRGHQERHVPRTITLDTPGARNRRSPARLNSSPYLFNTRNGGPTSG
jgi:hypothetical protein